MNSDNDIRREFQSKFGDFKAPVPADGWDEVERSLKVLAAARRAARRRWYAGSAAAVLILLIGSVLFFQMPVNQTETMVSEASSPASVKQEKLGIKTETAKQPDASVPPVAPSKRNEQYFAARTAGGQQKPAISKSASPGIIEAWLRRERGHDAGEERKLEPDDLQAVAKPIDTQKEDEYKNLQIEEFVTVGEREVLFAEKASRDKKEEKLMLAVNGKGGLSSFHQTVNSPMTLRSAALPESSHFSAENKK